MFNRRLTKRLDERKELHDMQYGFREGRSTVDAIEVSKLARAANEAALQQKNTEQYLRRVIRN